MFHQYTICTERHPGGEVAHFGGDGFRQSAEAAKAAAEKEAAHMSGVTRISERVRGEPAS